MPTVVTEFVTQLFAAAPVTVRVTTNLSTWEKVAAIFTAVGGIGAMLGAGAAWRAALASGQAARDATDALAAQALSRRCISCSERTPAMPSAGQVLRSKCAPLLSVLCRRRAWLGSRPRTTCGLSSTS